MIFIQFLSLIRFNLCASLSKNKPFAEFYSFTRTVNPQFTQHEAWSRITRAKGLEFLWMQFSRWMERGRIKLPDQNYICVFCIFFVNCSVTVIWWSYPKADDYITLETRLRKLYWDSFCRGWIFLQELAEVSWSILPTTSAITKRRQTMLAITSFLRALAFE